MYIHTRDVSRLNSNIYRTLYKLNFRENGQMQGVLKDFYRGHTTRGHARVFWIEQGGMIVSWSIVFSYRDGRMPSAYFYTHRSYRRRGYASKLLKAIEKRYSKVEVFPHDERATGFFSTFKTRKIKRVYY